jgi:hypothetical protein
MALQSQLFRGDPQLEAAAISDPARIVPGAMGPHVGKLQQALIQVDAAPITVNMIYGPPRPPPSSPTRRSGGSSISAPLDLSSFRIAAIGGRPIESLC